MTRKISSVLKSAALSTVLVCGPLNADAGRMPLSRNEASAIKNIFGDTVDTTKSTKTLDKRKREVATKRGEAIPVFASIDRNGNMSFYDGMHSDDYGMEMDVEKYAAFIHEGVHLWQQQTQVWDNLIFGAYGYDLTGRKVFSDLTADQQATLIEDYACLFLHPSRRAPVYALRGTPTERLAQVVEDAFPQAALTRRALEQQREKGSAPHAKP